MRAKPEFPIDGIAVHKCKNCKIVTRYSGLLFLSDLQEPPTRKSVRSCPTCGSPVIPAEVA